MTQGTNPTIKIEIEGADSDKLLNYEIYFKQDKYNKFLKIGADRIELTQIDGNNFVFRLRLTQLETLSFSYGESIRIQVRLLLEDDAYPEGMAIATDITIKNIDELLDTDEIKARE